jgi:dihydrofolate synthase/folylpolyglutamate synthase
MIDAVLDRLTRLHPKVIDLSLDRIRRLLDRLGNPERRLPPVIHVAGTNGKGSTVATLRAICEAAGRRVHVYTSPHLVRFAERIRIAGTLPEDAALIALLAEVEAANEGGPITFFEVTTAAALLAFSRVAADACLLETGLGGRLDATNVVERPALTILTPIALDHQHYLGDGIEAIAGEKAAIIKPGVPCISAEQERGAAQVIARHAQDCAAPLLLEGVDFAAAASGDGLVFRGLGVEWRLPRLALRGAHQMRNAALALAATRRLYGDAIGPPILAEALAAVEWPARLQRLTRGPLPALLPAGWELWLDGGHNPHAAKALAAHAEGWADRPLLAVSGMLTTKDIDGILAPLAGRLAALRAVAIPGEANAASAEMIAAAAARHGIAARPAADIAAALADFAATVAGPARVLICGSLYLAGTVLTENG